MRPDAPVLIDTIVDKGSGGNGKPLISLQHFGLCGSSAMVGATLMTQWALFQFCAAKLLRITATRMRHLPAEQAVNRGGAGPAG
jgi:hypothetical protein